VDVHPKRFFRLNARLLKVASCGSLPDIFLVPRQIRNSNLEDYSAAHISRLADVEVLIESKTKRTTAAAHLGGVAVECRLKELVIGYHQLTAWDQASKRPKDTWNGRPIPRPGHSLIGAVKLMSKLHEKARTDPLFLTHLNRVIHPTGATEADYIELRYSAYELGDDSLMDWRKSFDYVLGWLKKNEAML